MSNLIDHANRELRTAGLFDKDSDYNGMIAQAVMPLIGAFSAQGHSGMSASIVVDLFSKLARFEALTPLTDDPDEWCDVSEASGTPMWQSKRASACFSHDGCKTYYHLDEPHGADEQRVMHRSFPQPPKLTEPCTAHVSEIADHE